MYIIIIILGILGVVGDLGWGRSQAVFHPEVFCKRGHNGLFKILRGGHHVVWACEVQIPRGHRIQEGENAPPPH